MRTIEACIFGLIGLAVPAAANAADISAAGTVNDGVSDIQKIVLKGQIKQGDRDRLDRVIKTDGAAVVSFNSPGGSYQEGLKIAQLLKERFVRSIVEDGASCVSACAIAFLGGSTASEEGGDATAARSIGPHARLDPRRYGALMFQCGSLAGVKPPLLFGGDKFTQLAKRGRCHRGVLNLQCLDHAERHAA